MLVPIGFNLYGFVRGGFRCQDPTADGMDAPTSAQVLEALIEYLHRGALQRLRREARNPFQTALTH